MSIERATEHLKKFKATDKIKISELSSATVALAAIAFNCKEQEIAKTLSFRLDDSSAILIVMAGDAKIDNAKYKNEFKCKAHMLPYEEVESTIGHKAGGVCPFGVNDGIKVYLDVSLKRFEHVYPACGSDNSAVELTISELEEYSLFEKWVDVCKIA